MKNNKFCFNKNVGFVLLVMVVLVGVAVAMQVVVNTKKTTNSRASEISQTVPALSPYLCSAEKKCASGKVCLSVGGGDGSICADPKAVVATLQIRSKEDSGPYFYDYRKSSSSKEVGLLPINGADGIARIDKGDNVIIPEGEPLMNLGTNLFTIDSVRIQFDDNATSGWQNAYKNQNWENYPDSAWTEDKLVTFKADGSIAVDDNRNNKHFTYKNMETLRNSENIPFYPANFTGVIYGDYSDFSKVLNTPIVPPVGRQIVVVAKATISTNGVTITKLLVLPFVTQKLNYFQTNK